MSIALARVRAAAAASVPAPDYNVNDNCCERRLIFPTDPGSRREREKALFGSPTPGGAYILKGMQVREYRYGTVLLILI